MNNILHDNNFKKTILEKAEKLYESFYNITNFDNTDQTKLDKKEKNG